MPDIESTQKATPSPAGPALPPVTIVIFGASGDLTHRKLVPALYTLAVEGRLPENYAVVGVARSNFDDNAFLAHLKTGVEENARLGAPQDGAWENFASHLCYLQGDYDDPATYSALGRLLGDMGSRHGTGGNCLFYLATPPPALPGRRRPAGQGGPEP